MASFANHFCCNDHIMPSATAKIDDKLGVKGLRCEGKRASSAAACFVNVVWEAEVLKYVVLIVRILRIGFGSDRMLGVVGHQLRPVAHRYVQMLWDFYDEGSSE